MWKRLTRLWRHRWTDESDLHRALPPQLLERLRQRVADSEARHRGEIRVHAEAGLPWSYLWRDATARERAVAMFAKLHVWDTEWNNGVLIYLLLAERRIEVVADRGLSVRVDPQQWQDIVASMGQAFRAGEFEQGLGEAIDRVSALLEQHFPAPAGEANPNELPDTPTLG